MIIGIEQIKELHGKYLLSSMFDVIIDSFMKCYPNLDVIVINGCDEYGYYEYADFILPSHETVTIYRITTDY